MTLYCGLTKKHKERKNKSPSKKNTSRIFPLGNTVGGALKTKWLLCIWMQVGGWGQPMNNWASQQSSKSYRTCALFAVLWTCVLGIACLARWWDLCSTREGAEQHSGLMWPFHEGNRLSPGLKLWADDRSTRVCCVAHCRAPGTSLSLIQPTSQHMAPLTASAGQGEDRIDTRCQWPHTHWQSHAKAARLE